MSDEAKRKLDYEQLNKENIVKVTVAMQQTVATLAEQTTVFMMSTKQEIDSYKTRFDDMEKTHALIAEELKNSNLALLDTVRQFSEYKKEIDKVIDRINNETFDTEQIFCIPDKDEIPQPLKAKSALKGMITRELKKKRVLDNMFDGGTKQLGVIVLGIVLIVVFSIVASCNTVMFVVKDYLKIPTVQITTTKNNP